MRGKINLAEKFALFTEQWTPKIVGEIDDYEVKLARIEGAFEWHAHADADELFLIVEGDMVIELRDRTVSLAQGEIFVVPKGVEHKPVASAECKILVLERKGTVNTGDGASGERTVAAPERI
jgi:mannose-6-phosphate isomerase-like protein (cupin superfamily)